MTSPWDRVVGTELLTWQKEGQKETANLSLIEMINVSAQEPSGRGTCTGK